MTNKEKALKLINEYLAKQEPHKVELSLSDDLAKIINKSDEIISAINKQSNDLSRLFKEVKDVSDDFDKINNKRNTEIKNGKSTLQEINSIIDKIQTQAKELGIQPKNIPNFSKAIKSITELRSAANDIQKYSDFNL